jgi:glycosyltransferase involved in cell wall biosynthesis
MTRPRVLLVRGHQANSWHLRPWRHLEDEFDVAMAVTPGNWFDTSAAGIRAVEARTLRDRLPAGRAGDLLVRGPGDRYLDPEALFAGFDVVHSQDLVFWYSAQAARLKERLGFKLVLTAWETLPLLGAYRNVRTRPYRRDVLAATDRFLATSEKARNALLLEGAAAERVEVCPPGVDDELFRAAAAPAPGGEHLVLSAGRLVWEKGHQEVLRAVAALAHGVVAGPVPRALIIGAGPEEDRLRRHAEELDVADRVEFRREVPYAEMASVYASASCLVLGSLPTWGWEEQFGMVLVEALFAGLPVVAASSGAIPEVLADRGTLFAPGDWDGLARALAAGPLARPAGTRVHHDGLEPYRGRAFAQRLATAYRHVLAT